MKIYRHALVILTCATLIAGNSYATARDQAQRPRPSATSKRTMEKGEYNRNHVRASLTNQDGRRNGLGYQGIGRAQATLQADINTREPSAIHHPNTGGAGLTSPAPIRGTSAIRRIVIGAPPSQVPTAVRPGVDTAAIGGASHPGRRTTDTVDGTAMHRKP